MFPYTLRVMTAWLANIMNLPGKIDRALAEEAVWVPVLNEVLQAKQEFDNKEDQYVVAVIKTTPHTDEVTVGHVPRSISRMCWYFIQHNGETTCKNNTKKKAVRSKIKIRVVILVCCVCVQALRKVST